MFESLIDSLRRIGAIAFAAIVLVSISGASAHAAPFDHSPFNTLLRTAVVGGRVDYARFKNNQAFKAYLNALSTADVTKLSRNDQLAFWVNAYNACTIQNVLNNPGMKRPTDVAGFFDRARFNVARRSLTLNDIENSVIRPTFREPLIHFGLVCAALNCPPLIASAYTGNTVKAVLATNARRYLASTYNRFDATTKTLYLSKIFEWYASDFGGEKGTLRFVATHGTDAMKRGIAAGGVTVKFLDYDWTLNSR